MPDRRTFPLEGSGRTFPLRWTESAFPLPYARRTRFKKNFIPLLTVHWHGGTKDYSFQGVRFKNRFYDDRLLQVASTRREVQPLGGEYSISQGSAWLNNTDGELSALRADEAWRNVLVELKFGNVYDGPSGFPTIATMNLIDWRFEEGRTKIVYRDAMYDRFRQKVTNSLYQLTVEVFPDRPERQAPVLVPLVYGTHDTGNLFGSGVLPCYPIDPALSQAKYRYVVGHGRMKEVTNVYVYGIYTASGYTVSYNTYGGQEFTCIDFDADPFDPDRPTENEVTCDAKGLTDDGTESGILLERPSEILAYFLIDWANTIEGELDLDLFNVEIQAEEDNDYLCALAITEREEMYSDIIAKWSDSFLKCFFTTRLGLFGVYGFIGSNPDPDPVGELTDNFDAIDGSLGIDNNKTVASHLLYRFGYQYAKEYWGRQRIGNFVGEEGNLGEVILKESKFHYVRDIDTADAVAESRLYLLTESAQFPALALPVQFYTMDLNQFWLITHWMGIGANGYEDASARVLNLTIDVEPQNMKVAAGMVHREF